MSGSGDLYTYHLRLIPSARQVMAFFFVVMLVCFAAGYGVSTCVSSQETEDFEER